MKILIVASYNKNRYAPFIVEQANALVEKGCEVEYFGIVGKGIKGYIKAYKSFVKKIKESKIFLCACVEITKNEPVLHKTGSEN